MSTQPAAAALVPPPLLELAGADERDALIERGMALLQQANTILGVLYSGPADALSELVHLSRRLHDASSIRAFCQQLQSNLSAASNGSGDDDTSDNFLSDSPGADKPTAQLAVCLQLSLFALDSTLSSCSSSTSALSQRRFLSPPAAKEDQWSVDGWLFRLARSYFCSKLASIAHGQ